MTTRRGTDRREIRQRSASWATRSAGLLRRAGVRPNQVSVASLVVAALGAVALVWGGHATGAARAALLLVAAVCLPLRLLCNMLDGMLAVEGGLSSPTGDLFNELPDRAADLVLLTAAGYATAGAAVIGGVDVGVLLGWAAATLAVGTAYVRTLGAAQGVGNFFAGPMPKPARMWVLLAACLVSVVEPTAWRGAALLAASAVVTLGSLATIVVRLRLVAAALRAGSGGAT